MSNFKKLVRKRNTYGMILGTGTEQVQFNLIIVVRVQRDSVPVPLAVAVFRTLTG